MLRPYLSILQIVRRPKTPPVQMRPYKVFGISHPSICFPAAHQLLWCNQVANLHNFTILGCRYGHGSSCCPIHLPLLLPPTITYDFQKQELARSKASGTFLSNLTSFETGCHPRNSLEVSSKRDYGSFSKEIRKISSEISWEY